MEDFLSELKSGSYYWKVSRDLERQVKTCLLSMQMHFERPGRPHLWRAQTLQRASPNPITPPTPMKRSNTNARVMSYHRSCSWWSDPPWLDAGCVYLLFQLDSPIFTRSRASSPTTLWRRDAVGKWCFSFRSRPSGTSSMQSSSRRQPTDPSAPRSASPSSPRSSDHAGINIKGGGGGGASAPELPKRAS